MPKKRIHQFAKPASVPHPSLTSGRQGAAGPSHNGSHTTTTSVNDLIRHLRQTQLSSSTPERAPDDPNTPTVHPSLKAILDIPDTPAPRPRPGMRISGGRRIRGPAGPAAPKSWLTQRNMANQGSSSAMGRVADRRLGSLPGTYLPSRQSLEHLTLKALAQDWEWHKEYDQFYLATLPRRFKETLLSYIAAYNDQGIDCEGLHILFLDETELEGATGCESITHLDLGTAAGRALKLKELKDVFMKKPTVYGTAATGKDEIPESWEEDMTPAAPLSMARFPNLTHLSLSHPAIASWKGLLALSPHLATLTHLSLAYWPTPSITPNSKTAYRESPAGNIDYGASNFYSHTDGDLSEASGVLKRLSKATYCLQWLDLTGCSDWIQALGRMDGPDWRGAWRGVENLKIGQGWIPHCLEAESSVELRQLYSKTDNGGINGPDDVDRQAQWKELVAWGTTEINISRAQTGIERAIRFVVVPSATGASQDVRPRKIKFDRGWEGWWIKDALEDINPVTSVAQSIDFSRWR